MKILIDAMGGDNAPKAPVLGAIEAVKLFNENVVLVGREDEIRAVAKEAGYETLPAGIEIVHAPGVVDMTRPMSAAGKRSLPWWWVCVCFPRARLMP